MAEVAGGELVRLENGRTRDEVVDWLIATATPDLVVGMDFAFSLPAWYLRERGLTARGLWAALAGEALTPVMRERGLARWLAEPEPPFWRTRKADSGLRPGQEFRRTEEVARAAGYPAKSVFQLVGAGQVGRGSLHGMRALHRLAAAGFRVWPFDPPRPPFVAEVYPRMFTGGVTKSDRAARARAVTALPERFRPIAASTEDAFDAAMTAIAMAAGDPGGAGDALEGRIWGC
ncbi:hypothetical protein GCM10017786_03720 [Amycolatopsis deserti]|uniref:DUF429 domain-containing protein n=1 Tax=Amycolatopsis deserti TaxID=185696 RepID=A0ABQ3IE07_9PSEU|nr:hypothetical protein GCM10017786_03720 [Amycolatopsis deserti]